MSTSAIQVLGAVGEQTARQVVKVPQQEYDFGTRTLPAIGLGALGFLLWKKHPILGLLAGASVGDSIFPLLRGSREERIDALARLGVEGAAVAGALAWKKHPVWGYLGATAAGVVATSFVPGTSGYGKLGGGA